MVKHSSLTMKAPLIGFTFSTPKDAISAAGPIVRLQVLRDEKGLSAGQVRQVVYTGTGLLILSYIVLAFLVWRRYKRSAERARQAEQAAAR
jgi:hypothetical protein